MFDSAPQHAPIARMPMLTMEEIRELYPAPSVRPIDEHMSCSDKYCVGAAFLRAIGDPCELSYPPYKRLAAALSTYNRNLCVARADELGHLIARANDDGLFELAWRYLKEALTACDSSGPLWLMP